MLFHNQNCHKQYRSKLLNLLLRPHYHIHMYFYQFIVTFELKFFEALKNSLIMTIGFLPINIFIFAIPVVLIAILLFLGFTTIGMLILSIIFLVAFLRYPIEFLASRLILRKVITEAKEDEGNKSAKN